MSKKKSDPKQSEITTPNKMIPAVTTTTATSPETKLNTSGKTYPSDWQEQLEQIIRGMRQFEIDLGGERTADTLDTKITKAVEYEKELGDLMSRAAAIRDERDKLRLETWQLGYSVRIAVGGLYGMDSPQYQGVGGKRTSERKTGGRKPKTT